MSQPTITITEDSGRYLLRISGPYLLAGQIRHSMREAMPSLYRGWSQSLEAWSFPLHSKARLERWLDGQCGAGVGVVWEGRV